MTSYNKVAPAPGPGGSSSGPSDPPREDRRSTNGIKQVAVKLFGSPTSQDGQGATGFRTEAHLEDSPGLPSMSSSDYLEEIAEVQRLSSLPEFLTANAEDPGFTLLHYVALLGNTTLAAALRHAQPDVQRRYASIARYLVRTGSEVIITDQYGCIPLQLAASIGNRDMVEALLEPFEGQAVRRQHVKRNDYLNHQDSQIRFTALHGALNHAQHEVAILLLERGANPQVLDMTRNNAFQVAPSLESLQELLRLVVQHEDVVPTPAIAQLMIEVIKQQEARDKAEAARAKAAAAAAAAEAARGDDDSKAKVDWSKALNMAPNLDYAQRTLLAMVAQLAGKASGPPGSGAAADAAKGGAHGEAGGEVGAIIKRLFKELYAKMKHDDIWEYVRAAVDYNNYKLTQMMLDFVCAECPRALADCNWEDTLGPLIACFPDLFHGLLRKLQFMSDSEVIGFVRSMRLSSFHSTSANAYGSLSPMANLAMASVGNSSGHHNPAPAHGFRMLPGRASISISRAGGKGAAHQGKILIYQQLVEGLKDVNYVVVKAFFERADQDLLLDMAHFPIFKDFVGLMGKKKTSEGFTESDSGRQRLLDLLRSEGGYDGDRDYGGRDYGGDGDSGPVLLGRPDPPDRTKALSTGTLLHFHSNIKDSTTSREQGDTDGAAGGDESGAKGGKGVAADRSARRLMTASSRSRSGVVGGGSKGSQVVSLQRQHGGGVGRRTRQGAGPREADLAVQTLDVERVLRAAIKARKSMNVEATVKAVTSWVDINSRDRKAVFVTGISTELLKELATRFPTSGAKLLNLVSREVLEQLTTLQVSAALLYRKDMLVKCSNVRNHFTWRAPELQQLADETGFDEHVVDALADYGIPFECVYKAVIDGGASKAHFALLIQEHFTGAELKELVANGIQLSRVVDIITKCQQPPFELPNFKAEPMTQLIKDMLKEKLSFRIVEAILDAGAMNEATVYTNFRPGNPLFNAYPLPLYKPVYTHHFVQLLLTNWKKGAKDMQGNVTLRPWDKKFIDTIFAPNDSLCTALKSAYDNKLKDTQVYIEGSGVAVEGWAKKQRSNRSLVLSAFVCNALLLHRWPVFVMMHLLLWLTDSLRAVTHVLGWEWVSMREQQAGHSVDARALVIPWRGIADLGEEHGMLTALIDVDVPVRWFGFAAVKAAITVQWQEYGQMLMLMSALAHISFMALFGGFLLVVRNAGEEAGGDMSAVRSRPEVMALMMVLGVLSVGGLTEELFQLMRLTWRAWRNYLGNLVDLTSFALFVVLFGMVWASYTYDVILAVGAVETLVLFVRLVFFASMTDSMGSLMRMVIEIIKDMRYFFLLLGMIFGGFAIAFAVLQGGQNTYEAIAFKLFAVMLGDWQYDYLLDMLNVEDLWVVPRLSVLLMCVYGILMLIVLVNLLIAIMNDTYDRIKETEEIEVLHNRARLIVDLESLLTPAMREKLQSRLLGRYLHVLMPADKKFNKFIASAESAEGGWKGRMRAFSEALKRDVDPQLRELSNRVGAESDRLAKEIAFVKSWVEQQRRMMAEVAEEAGAGPGPGGRNPRGSTTGDRR